MFLQFRSEPKVDATTPMPEMAAATPPRPMAPAPDEAPEPAEAPPPDPSGGRPMAAPAPSQPSLLQLPPSTKTVMGGAGPTDTPEGDANFSRSATTGQQPVAQSGAPAAEAEAPPANTAMPKPNFDVLAADDGAEAQRAERQQDDELVIAEAASARRPSSREKKTAEAPAAGAAYAPAPVAAAKTEAMEADEPPIWPQDYRESWYVGDAEVEPIYRSARALEQTGQWTAAAVAYRPLLASGRSSVAQDAAWRCASAWWKAGQGSTALSTIEEGLRRSSANTPYRARLFALKGDILSAQGKAAQAEAAWREARALNASR